MTVLKIEPFSGISGDMFLAAAAQLADAEAEIIDLPAALGLPDVDVVFIDVLKKGIRCRQVTITDRTAPKDRPHRMLTDILKLIDRSRLPVPAKTRAAAMFTALGEAEAAVHGVGLDQVHFHEVGAVDSIIDIVGAALLIEKLGITAAYCDPVCTGFGFVMTEHGRLPVPAPATAALLQGLPVLRGPCEGEMTTPTGAVILRSLQPVFATPALVMNQTAYGAGQKDFDHPNCLRISRCDAAEPAGDMVLIQCGIDDMPGEQLGRDLQDKLLELGAVDVFLTPLIMKKGRPGVKLEVLAPPSCREALANAILEDTLTLGVRFIPVTRKILPREQRDVDTPYGPVSVKCATLPSGKIRCVPEYASCQAAATQHGVSVHEVYVAALKAAG